MADQVWGLEIRDILKAPGTKDGIFYTVLERFGDMSSAIAAVPVPLDGWDEVAEPGHYGKVIGKSAALYEGRDTGYRVYRLDPTAKLGPERRRLRRAIIDTRGFQFPRPHLRRWTRVLRRSA